MLKDFRTYHQSILFLFSNLPQKISEKNHHSRSNLTGRFMPLGPYQKKVSASLKQ